MPCISDDSGLEVDVLRGEPGIYSSRYAGEKSDEDRISKLLSALEDVPAENRGGTSMRCLLCFPGRKLITARGECPGTIAYSKRGTNGFGYDPIFIEQSSGLTFAN